MQVIEIIAAVVTIVGGVYGLWKWAGIGSKRPSGLFLKDGNIYLVYKTGVTAQISFANSDRKPILGSKRVVFFREEKIANRDRTFSSFKLMTIDVATLRESIVSDQKPFADGLDGSYRILQPGPLTFSVDETAVMFTIEKYVTASQLVQVKIDTGKWTELFSAEKIEVITAGKHKGKLLVGISEIRDKGRGVYYSICESDGKTLHQFSNYDEYMKFRGEALTKEV